MTRTEKSVSVVPRKFVVNVLSRQGFQPCRYDLTSSIAAYLTYCLRAVLQEEGRYHAESILRAAGG